MKPPNQPDPVSVQQVATLLKNGGTPQQLEACRVLMHSIPSAIASDLARGQRVQLLRAMLEEALTPDNGDLELSAAREYLGWVQHPYDSVIKAAGSAELAHDQALDSRASDEDRRAYREYLMSFVGVREVWAGRRLNPPHGLKVRTVRDRRIQIAKALLNAVDSLVEDTSRVEALARTISSQPPIALADLEPRAPDAVSDGTTAGTLFTALESQTLFIIGTHGGRRIHVNRRIRSEVERLEDFEDHYSGSDNPKVDYQFAAEYGCQVDADSQTRNSVGVVSAKFKLSKALARAAEHTIRYVIERRDPADEHQESKTWVLSFYTDEDPTLHERMLVHFDTNTPPSRAWWLIAQSPSKIPGKWSEDHNLDIDSQGCVEWEPPGMKRNLYYVICWEA
jgi:hypothetical protein